MEGEYMKRSLLLLAVFIGGVSVYAQSLSRNIATVSYTKTATISEKDYEKALKDSQKQLELYKQQGAVAPNVQITNAQRQELLNTMIDNIIVMQAAESAKITVTDANVLDSLRELTGMPKASLSDIQKAYKEDIAKVAQANPGSQPPTWDEFIRNVKDELAKQMYYQKMIKPRVPSDADIMKAYNENPDNFKIPEQARISLIFFNFAGLNADQKSAVRQKAEQASKEINAGSTTFEQAVSRYSDDPNSAARLGDIGYVPRVDALQQAFGANVVNAFFSQRPGVISPVVEGVSGYYIFKVTMKEPAKTLRLSDINPYDPQKQQTVQQLVRTQLMRNYWIEDIAKLTADLRKQSKVEINEGIWGPWARGEKGVS
jgi:parvulin-like peptidyl-prolyl isomerase